MNTGYFFDLDGTLYDNCRHEVSHYTMEALKALRQQGNSVFLATSRTTRELDHLPRNLFKFPFRARILEGGSLIVDQSQRVLRQCSIPTKIVQAVQAFCEQNDLIWRYSTRDGNYWGSPPDLAAHHAYFDLYLCAPVLRPYTNQEVLNILVFIQEPEYVKRLDAILSTCGVVHFDHAMEIRASHVDKIEAIRWCKKEFHLDRIVCFGDGQNDIEMIKGADLGICMGNGHPQLKEAADLVIGSVQDNGIYHFLTQQHIID